MKKESRNVPEGEFEQGFWLPENYALKLTALEAGALAAILCEARNKGTAAFPINKPGPNGEKIPTTMIYRLIEKLEDVVKAHP
jgi:hypothetical protein